MMVLLSIFPWTSKWHVISWDTFGYYLYLPEIFIYHDPGISNYDLIYDLIRKYDISSTFYQVHEHANGNHIIQYPIGMAIFYLPAFLVGHGIAIFSGYPADGLSAPYEWSMIIEHFLFVFAGLYWFRKLMLHYFSDKLTAVLLILLVFGTNYFAQEYHAVSSPHIYLFALRCAFLLQTIRWHNQPSKINGFILGLLLGIITICRVTEVLIVILPVLWNVASLEELKIKVRTVLKENRSSLAFAFMGVLIAVSPQLIFWKIVSGEFFYYSYRNAGEGLDLLEPHTLNFLFSFRKGWFVYSPLMIFSCFGFLSLKRANPKLFVPLLVFTVLNIYIISSWSCWWYGGGFGQRPMVQSYGLLFIPFGYFLSNVWNNRKLVRMMIALFCFFCIALNLFQTWQAVKYILHPSQMTMSYYFKVFGKTKMPPDTQNSLLVCRGLDPPDVFNNQEQYQLHQNIKFTFDQTDPFFKNNICDTFGFQSKKCLTISDAHPYSEHFTIPFYELTNNKDHAWIRIKMKYYFKGDIKEIGPTPVFVFLNRKGEKYDFTGFDLERDQFHSKAGEWNELTHEYLTPFVRSEKDNYCLYFWIRGKGTLFVDDIEIQSFYKKE